MALRGLPLGARDQAQALGGKLVTDKDAKSLLAQLKTTLSGCDTVCNAADLDPTGEGSLLGWEIVEFLGLQGKKA